MLAEASGERVESSLCTGAFDYVHMKGLESGGGAGAQ